MTIKGGKLSEIAKRKISETRRRCIVEGSINRYTNPKKQPIYELSHGIKVIGEHHKKSGYVMCYIEAHHLFPNTKINASSRQIIQRSRVIMTAHLGRILLSSEHVHHIRKEEKWNDDINNLELLTSDKHNKHHHVGLKHTDEVKERIARSVSESHRLGLHAKPRIIERDNLGRILRTA